MSEYLFNGELLADIRTRANSVTQTVNSSGSVTSVVYFYTNGSTITDIYTYGANSTTEPTVVTRGTLTTPLPPVTLSGFAVSTNGTSLTYSTTNGSITALSGTLTVAGVSRTLTHVSSGVATFSGAAVQTGQAVTLSITGSTPGLTAAVTNAAVANNSTFVPVGVTKQTVTWSSGSGVTASGDTVTLAATGSCGVASYAINTAAPFSVRGFMTMTGLAQVLVNLDSDNTPTTGYGAGTTAFLLGHSIYDNGLYTHLGGSTSAQLTARGSSVGFTYYEYASTGNGTVTFRKSPDGVTYTDVTSLSGLTGTIYVKVIQANLTNSQVNVQIYA